MCNQVNYQHFLYTLGHNFFELIFIAFISSIKKFLNDSYLHFNYLEGVCIIVATYTCNFFYLKKLYVYVATIYVNIVINSGALSLKKKIAGQNCRIVCKEY